MNVENDYFVIDRKALCQTLESRIDSETRTGWRAWIYNGLALSYVHNWWIHRYSSDITINRVDV